MAYGLRLFVSRVAKSSQEDQPRCDRRRAIDPEERLEGVGGQKPAQRRSDAKPEVDRQAVEREALFAQLRPGKLSHQGEVGRAKRLRGKGEKRHPCQYLR